MQDEQNPKMFFSLPASSTWCQWFCSEEAVRFRRFSDFHACWASKILILKVARQLAACVLLEVLPGVGWSYQAVWRWRMLTWSWGCNLQLSSLRWDVPRTMKAVWPKGSVHCGVQAGNSKPECFLCKMLKISFCCGQLGVFRANKQQTGRFLYHFPVANIRGLQLSWDHFFCQDTLQLLFHTRMKMYW